MKATTTTSVYDRGLGLLEAVTKNDLAKVTDLVRNGCMLQMDKEGRYPIHIAAENGFLDVLKYLLQTFPVYNVNIPDQSGNTPLHRAANIGNVEMIKVLLERGAQVNVQDVTGLFTPLHLAVQSGHNQTTRTLIKHGADIAVKNKFGDTPLHTAVRYGHAGVSRIIISVSTNLNHQNQNGDTSLHIAAALKRRKIVKLLIEAGAILDIRNYQNESPMDVAIKKNHQEILEIISSASRSLITNPKTVSFPPDISQDFFQVQTRHVSIPNEMSQIIIQTQTQPSRAQSQSPHEKIKPKKTNIVKGIFSRKKKDKGDKNVSNVKEEKCSLNSPFTPNKCILSCSKRKKSDQLVQSVPGVKVQSTSPSLVPGLMNTYQPQRGNLFFKDLAGNIRQGPIGFTPMTSTSCTCNCSQMVQGSIRNVYNNVSQSNVCMDHGYAEYHGPMSQNIEETPKPKEKNTRRVDQIGYPLTRAKSDESLNQSEHKMRMQEERLKNAKVSQLRSSPVKGRRQSNVENNWNHRQNSLIKDSFKIQNIQKISIQTMQQPKKERQEMSDSNNRPWDGFRSVMRPSPDGEPASFTNNTLDPPKMKVDCRAAKYRPDKVMLPSSKV